MKNKKILISTIVVATLFTLTGCGGDNAQDTSQNTLIESNTQPEQVDEIDKKEVPPVLIEDIELIDFKINPPNSIGAVYMEGKFKNNSDKNVTHVQYTYKFDDDKYYLGTYDTLLPGDTSSISDTFGPKSGNVEDMELLEIEITCLDENNEKIYIDYDVKLKTYIWH